MIKALFLVLPSLLALCVPLYNHFEPALFGFPLFYWFLLAIIPVSSIFTYLVYRGDKR